jgi:hypothetical protein
VGVDDEVALTPGVEGDEAAEDGEGASAGANEDAGSAALDFGFDDVGEQVADLVRFVDAACVTRRVSPAIASWDRTYVARYCR